MSNYNFSTLNDKEFEQISRDLLNAKFELGLQSFKTGRDKGIDLRFSTSKNNNSIVIQAKHYANSTFSQLKHILKEKELDNVTKLNPDRYIIVTSLPLAAYQKDEIKDLFTPYILTSNDVVGQEDLNAYLQEFGEIEKQHFKLWFSSINVFNSVINNAIEGRTRYMMVQIRKKIPFYVITKKLDDANKILQKEKLLLITGQPGIGKTTLAEIILFERAKNGYKIFKVENIKEAEDIISPDGDEKQLFYFDDFLGANYYEIVNVHKTETQITSFVDRVKNTPNKYLILTTRTVILNHAFDKYEKISHSKLANQSFEIKLTDYDRYEKALILYNHLYFKGVKEELYNAILNKKFYQDIIQHKNYTPRIIEFITETTRIEKLIPATYVQFILNNLNNPKEIWRYSFNNQIDYLDRCLLLTLFTFEGDSFHTALASAFQKRLQYEKTEHNQIISTDQFNDSVKILLNGFIISSLHNTSPPVRQYQFINPSLTDFLIGQVAESFPERRSIISSVMYVEQLKRFDPEKSLIVFEKELQILVRDLIAKGDLLVQNSGGKGFTENKRLVIMLETLCRYCKDVNIDNLLLREFKLISYDESWLNISTKLIYVLENIGDAPQTYEHIKDNFFAITEKIMGCIDDADQAKKIPLLFDKYGFIYEDYCETDQGFSNIIELIQSVLTTNEDEIKKDKSDEVRTLDQVNDLYYDLEYLESDLLGDLFPSYSISHDFGVGVDEEYWNNVIQENIRMDERRDKHRDDDYEDYYRDAISETLSEDEIIDDLFDPSV